MFVLILDDSVDSGLETDSSDRFALYIMMDARSRLEFLLTPAATQVLHDLAVAFTRSGPSATNAVVHSLEAPLTLLDDLGPCSRISLITKSEVRAL